MPNEGTPENTTGVLKADEPVEGTTQNTTGVIDTTGTELTPASQRPISAFDAEALTQEYHTNIAKQEQILSEREQPTWGDNAAALGRGILKSIYPLAQIPIGIAAGEVDAVGWAFKKLNLTSHDPAKVKDAQGTQMTELSYGDMIRKGSDWVGKRLNDDPLNQGLREATLGQRSMMTAANLVTDIGTWELSGLARVFRPATSLFKNKALMNTFGSWAFGGFGAEYAAKRLTGPAIKTFLKPAAQEAAETKIKAAFEVGASMINWAGEGALFVGAEKGRQNLIDLLQHHEPERAQDVAVDVATGAIVGAALPIAFGGLKYTPAGIKYVFKKGGKAITVFDRQDLEDIGNKAGNSWLGGGYQNIQSVLKGKWDKVIGKNRSNAEIMKAFQDELVGVDSDLTESAIKREGLYADLKKFSAKDWKSVPAAVFHKFARHIDEMKETEEGGADKYSWWSQFIKKTLPDVNFPTHGEYGRVAKYHKEGGVAIGKLAEELHEEIHSPLQTHEAERETLQRLKESKHYNRLSSENKERIENRIEQLGEHTEAHGLTKKLNEIEEINTEITEHNERQKVSSKMISEPTESPTDKLNSDNMVRASANQIPPDLHKDPKVEFEEANPLDEKDSQKVMEEEYKASEYDNLDEDTKIQAEENFEKIKKIESNHKPIRDLYEKTLRCIIGEQGG